MPWLFTVGIWNYGVAKYSKMGVSQNILDMVYKSLIESILSFNIIMWFGNLHIVRRNKLQRIVVYNNMASKIIGRLQLSSKYEDLLRRKSNKIINSSSHPLHREFDLLP